MKLKFYMIERNDYVDWDEYDSCVVLAESPEKALQMAKDHYGTRWACGWGVRFDGTGGWDVTVSEIDTSEARVILGSFNAG